MGKMDHYRPTIQSSVRLFFQETRDLSRQTNEQQQSTIRRLERQKTELTAILNKQAQLIDNLRRQKVRKKSKKVAFCV